VTIHLQRPPLAAWAALIAALCLAAPLSGCASISHALGHDKPALALTADEYPTHLEYQFIEARAGAISWFRRAYNREPVVPFARLVVEPRQRGSMGAWVERGVVIHIWEDQRPWQASLEHEWRHVLCIANGLGGSEEVVQ